MKLDFHTHSSFSNDSKSPLEEMIKGALERGITDIAITDHVDYDYDEEGLSDSGITADWDFDVQDYFAAIEQMKQKYQNQINIYKGVEVGIQPHLGERCNQLITENAFDFVIASLHTVDRKDLYNRKFFKTRTNEQALREYLEAYYESIIQMKDFSVLGHLDLYLRYWEPLKEEPIEKHFDQIETLFKYIIQKERGIELNSGGYFKYNMMANNPSDKWLRLFRELKGEVITLGSDSHSPEHLGTLHNENLKLLSDLGFKYVCTFEQMVPKYHAIKDLLK